MINVTLTEKGKTRVFKIDNSKYLKGSIEHYTEIHITKEELKTLNKERTVTLEDDVFNRTVKIDIKRG